MASSSLCDLGQVFSFLNKDSNIIYFRGCLGKLRESIPRGLLFFQLLLFSEGIHSVLCTGQAPSGRSASVRSVMEMQQGRAPGVHAGTLMNAHDIGAPSAWSSGAPGSPGHPQPLASLDGSLWAVIPASPRGWELGPGSAPRPVSGAAGPALLEELEQGFVCVAGAGVQVNGGHQGLAGALASRAAVF